ncbi:MAG TPA: ATP-binding protein [Alphaproteobacteria bacterium]|nr:ATP-binding protein [Alphaproteobacteria bacterium]
MLRVLEERWPALSPRTLVLATVVLFFAFSAATLVAVTLADRRATLAEAARHSQDLALLVQQHARGGIGAADAALLRVQDRLAGRDLDSARFDEGEAARLAAARHGAPIAALAVFDAAGRAVLSSAGFPANGGAVPDRAAFERLRAGEGRVLVPPAGGGFAVARRLAGPGGGFGGAAFATLEPDGFDRFYAELRLLPGAWIALLGEDGTALQRHPARAGADPVERRVAAEGLARADAGHFRAVGPDGAARLVAFRRLPALPVAVAVQIPEAAVLAPWRERLVRNAALFGVALLTLTVVAALALRALRRERRAALALRQRSTELANALLETERARAEAERANEARSRFLASASHDLRQPLQGARLFLDVLHGRLNGPGKRLIVEKAIEALQGGQSLLNALLDISTLQAGTVQPRIAAFAIGRALQALHHECESQARDRGLTLRVVGSGLAVRSDETLLLRMLRNLVVNAIRYTESGRILVGCRRSGNRLRIEVWDTGPGIPPDKQEAIFEEFVQLGNPQRDRRQGLGLGLSIVRMTGELLGHAVTLRSRPGRGSVFAVAVPLADPAEIVPEAPEPAPDILAAPAPRRDTVLVIEDDPLQLMSLELMLADWGYEVLAAATPTDAVLVLQGANSVPALIVSDYRLPGGANGVEAIAGLATVIGRDIPGILLTGDTDPELLRDAADAGCRVLHKPYEPAILRRAIAETLRDTPPARLLMPAAGR